MTVIDLPLPTMPADPELDVRCWCGSLKRDHAGRKHMGHCRGHAVVYDEPEGVVPATIIESCEKGCRRFWPARGERLRLRAIAAMDEPLMVAIAEADKARPRSRKTEDARAAGHFGVGPSDLNTCPKRIEYRERPPEDYEPIEVDRAAAYEGTILHDGITRARRLRYPWRKFGLNVHVPGLDREGELDEWDPITAVVVDYKTAGEYKWDRIGNYGPPETEWEQVMLYALALVHAGHPVEWVELHYYRRENFTDPERFRRPFSEQIAMAALSRLHAILDDLHDGRSLERTEPGPNLSAICARFCEAVNHCWQVNIARDNGRTPEGWMLARDDAGVAVALEEYVTAHEDLFKPGNATKEAVKVKIEGVEWGRYGDYTYRKTGGKSEWVPDEQARVEQLIAEMTQAAQEGRPPVFPDQLPVPQRLKTTRMSTEIKRVRKAILEAEAAEAAAAADGE